MRNLEFKQICIHDAEIKVSEDGSIKGFTGYASVYGGEDSYGDTIHPGAYDSIAGNGITVKMYFNHEWIFRNALPIGLITLKADDRGLKVVSAEFTPGIKMAEEVQSAVRHKTITGLSIGYHLSQASYKMKENGGRDIYKVDELKEVSVVDFPADSNALITGVKSAIEEIENLKDAESLLRDVAGFSKSNAVALVSRIRTLTKGDPSQEVKEVKPAEIKNLFDNFKITI